MPKAPRAYLYSEDDTIIGAPFFVMQRRRGLVVRRTIPEAYKDIPDAPARMSEALVDALADLHSVNYRKIGLSSLGKPEGFIERQVTGWHKRWHVAKSEDLREMTAVHAWLATHIPASSAAALVHNDFKLDNVMLDPQDPGHIVAIFDWDMCTLGDPLADLGALLTYWTSPSDPPFMQSIAATFMPAGVTGFLEREQLIDRYQRRSGRDVSDIGFYQILGLYRVAVIIAQIYIRFVRGQTQDQRFAKYGPVIPLMARAAAALIP
jgi:aminoglycoside phosphotransferase (APT) family kinase protein